MKRYFAHAFGRSAALAVLALSALLGSGAASAAGTAAGTTIGNKATLSYSVGGVLQAPIGSAPGGNGSGTGTTTTFVVDNKINLNVITNDLSPAQGVPGQTAVTTTFTVTNTGNSTQDYFLTTGNVASGATVLTATDNFDVVAASCSMTVGGVLQNYIANLAPDANTTVQVICPIPAGRNNADVAAVYLQAEARAANSNGATTLTAAVANTAGVDIVFADGVGTEDVLRDAKFSTRSAYRVTTAVLNIAKTVTSVCDPFNGSTTAMNVPGGYVQYTVAITNNGSASATLGTITDKLDANVAFDQHLITGAGVGGNCAVTGTPTAAANKGFKIVQTNRPAANYPKYLTSTSADADGAGVTGAGDITVDFNTAMPVEGAYGIGELKTGETVQLIYQVRIN